MLLITVCTLLAAMACAPASKEESSHPMLICSAADAANNQYGYIVVYLKGVVKIIGAINSSEKVYYIPSSAPEYMEKAIEIETAPNIIFKLTAVDGTNLVVESSSQQLLVIGSCSRK